MRMIMMTVFGTLAIAAALFAAEEAAPAAQAKEAAPAAAEKKDEAEPKADEKAAGPAPKFPLKSEWFIHIADLQPDDKTVGDVEEAQQLEQHALEDILVALKASSDEQIKNGKTPDVTFRKLMREAENYRGHVVQFRGLMEGSERFPIPDNKAGVTDVWRGQISTIYGELYSFISIERPDNELIKHPVRISGVFMKRYAYMNRQAGEKLTWTPMIIVKKVEPFSEADVAPSGMSNMTKMAIALAVVLLLGRLAYRVTYMQSRTPKGNPFTKVKKRLAEKAASPAAPGAPPSPAASAEAPPTKTDPT